MPENVTPAILEASNQFREQLLERERRAASAMVRYYGQTWRDLQPRIEALRNEVEEIRDAGKMVGPGKIWQLERLEAIERQVEGELSQFAQYADETITAGQREAIAAAERDAKQLILAGFPPDAGIEVSFERMPREAVEALAGFLADGSPLADLLEEAVGEAQQGFMDTMVAGLAQGWNPRKLARELRSRFGMGLTRALRISRTEQLRAYRTATQRAYQESGMVKGWERHAQKGSRTCLACIALDGRQYDTSDAMDDHVNGRCAMLPITKSYAELGIDAEEPDFQRELASDWFRRLEEPEQREMMGPGMFEAWQDGEFALEDIPKVIRSDVWGDSWVPKPLKELIEQRAAIESAKWGQEVEEKLLRYTERTGNEMGAIVDLDGALIEEFTGGKDRILLPGWIANGEQYVFTHTHPGSSSFSPGDILHLVNGDGLKAMRAVGADGTRYILSKPDDFTRHQVIHSEERIRNEWRLGKDKLYGKYRDLVADGSLTNHEAWKEHSHEIIELVADILGLDYTRILP